MSRIRKSSERKNIALIGYGYWGKRLLKYLLEQFHIECIYGRSLDNHGVFTNNLEEAFRDEIDAVVIATPMDTHYSLVRRALKAGKHVLCEKPLAFSTEEVKYLYSLADVKKLHLVTEYTYTFSRGINQAVRWIEEGKIGELLAVEMSLRYIGRFLPFDVYWLLASHMLSVLDMVIPINELEFKKTEIISRETGVITFSGKIKGQIFVSINYPPKETRIVAYGKGGTLVFDAFKSPELKYYTYKRTPGVHGSELVEKKIDHSSDEKNNLRHAVSFFADILDCKISDMQNRNRAFRVTEVLNQL